MRTLMRSDNLFLVEKNLPSFLLGYRKMSNETITPAVLQELQNLFGSTVNSRQLYNHSPKILYAARRGELKKIGHGKFELSSVALAGPAQKTEKQIAETITERFDALEMLSDAMISGNIRAMIVSGAPGVGKTHTLESKLKDAQTNNKIKSVNAIKGSVSAIGLFLTLWENKESGNVLVLDDIDSIFNDEEALNLLKGALDTGKTRTISWIKDSTFLRDREIPNTFEYEGQIAFLTNVDLDSRAAKEGKYAPHICALISRCVFLDLGIHSPREIMVRIKQVCTQTSFLRDLNLSLSKATILLGWMEANINKLRSVSLRTMIQLAGFIATTAEWEKLARTTMLKPSFQ